METTTFRVRTGRVPAVVDVTRECAEFVRDREDGLLSVFVPHATAGVALVETGSGTDADLLAAVDRLLPAAATWEHAHGSPGHGRDHVLPAFVAPSLVVPVLAGRLALGRWQSVAAVDPNGDNPEREVRLSFLAG